MRLVNAARRDLIRINAGQAYETLFMASKEIVMRLITGLVVFVLLLILVLVALPRGAARGAPQPPLAPYADQQTGVPERAATPPARW